jgi:hypothetical protein
MKNRSVLFLGEAGHYDTATTQIKVNMISYLNDKGVHSALFEITPFISSYVFSCPEYDNFTKDWQIQSFFSMWLGHQPFQSLFEKIKKRQITVFGIDSHAGFHDIRAVRAILHKYTTNEPFILDWDKLDRYYIDRLVLGKEMPEKEQFEMMQMIDSISTYTQYLINKKGKNMDLESLIQWQRNINTMFSYNLYVVPYEDSIWDESFNMRNIELSIRNRDSQMAENILWMTEHFPNEKFTVWSASYHGAKDISLTMHPKDSLLYFIQQCAGEGVYNKLGDKFYSLAITSLQDNSDNPIELLEDAISKQTNDAPYAFIDFVPLRYADGFRDKEFGASMIKKKRGKWLYIFDGIYYIGNRQAND